MRLILMSRCSLENPSSDDRFLRTRSPSRRVTGRSPVSISLTISAFAIVDFPDPESPVKKTVKPCLLRGGKERRSSWITSGKLNQSGISSPSIKRRRISVPDISSTVEFFGISLDG